MCARKFAGTDVSLRAGGEGIEGTGNDEKVGSVERVKRVRTVEMGAKT